MEADVSEFESSEFDSGEGTELEGVIVVGGDNFQSFFFLNRHVFFFGSIRPILFQKISSIYI